MEEYLERHEAFVAQVLAMPGDQDWDGLSRHHRIQIEYMQHERLVHLLVTLCFGLFALLAALATAAFPGIALASLVLLLLVLLVPYVVHYFRLENGVQRWYHLAGEIERRAGRVAGDYRPPSKTKQP